MVPCKTAKTMRFHVWDIVYDVGDIPKQWFNPKNHRDIGQEFTITDPDDTRPFWERYYGAGYSNGRTAIDYISIANMLSKKLFGQDTTGYAANWVVGKEFIEGNVGGLWYIKRVI